MDPITVIAGATSIIRALGLDDKLGQLLGGKKGAEIAQRVTTVAQVVTGAKDPERVVQAISQDMEMWSKLNLRLLELAEMESRLEAEDRASARAMQVAALGQDDLFSKRFVYWFAAAWSLFAMGYIVLITFTDIPLANTRFADTILGFLLGTIVATIIVYFFGSSKGSQGKDSTVGALVEQLRDRK